MNENYTENQVTLEKGPTTPGNDINAGRAISESEFNLLKKSLRFNRFLLSLVLVLLIVFMAAFGFVCYESYNYVKKAEPIINSVSKIDYSSINSAMKLLEGLEEVDIDALSKGINDVDFDKIAELIDSVDVEEIQEAMDGLSTASQLLENVTEKVSPFLSFFK